MTARHAPAGVVAARSDGVTHRAKASDLWGTGRGVVATHDEQGRPIKRRGEAACARRRAKKCARVERVTLKSWLRTNGLPS